MGNSETTSSPSPATVARSRRRSLRRIALLLAAASILTAGALGLGLWWQDRPLARIESALEGEEFQFALNSADRYLADHPRDSRAQILKARALSRLERHQDADELFRQIAVRFNGFPDDPAALRDWSISLLRLKLWLRAIPILETLVAENPTDPELLYPLTVARMRVRQYETALKSAEQLAEIDGQENQADLLIGTIHHDQGNRRLALKRWESLLQRNSEAKGLTVTPGHFFEMVGEEYLELGQPQRAIAVLDRGLPQRRAARIHLLLGNAYSQVNRPADAVRSWNRVLESDRSNPTAREQLANAALREGEAKKALAWLQPLRDNSRLRSSTTYILQRAYGKLKNTEQAAYWKRQTETLRQQESEQATAKRRLRDLRDPFWSVVLRAYELAEERKFQEAETLVEGLLKQRPQDAFLLKLRRAMKSRGPLPVLPK